MEPIVRPFFFSDGTVELFNEEFLRIESMTLAIDNGVAQRRFIGKSDKRHQNSIRYSANLQFGLYRIGYKC